MQKDKRMMAMVVSIVAMLILAASFFAYQAKADIYSELYSLKLIPRAELFTELYFVNPSALPLETVAKQPMTFAFAIHNVEGATTTYPYEVYFVYPDGSTTTLQKGVVSLADGASTTISVSHTFKSSNLEGEVIVNLTSLNQGIDFLLPNPNYPSYSSEE